MYSQRRDQDKRQRWKSGGEKNPKNLKLNTDVKKYSVIYNENTGTK